MHTCWDLTLCQHWAGGILNSHGKIVQWYLMMCLFSNEEEIFYSVCVIGYHLTVPPVSHTKTSIIVLIAFLNWVCFSCWFPHFIIWYSYLPSHSRQNLRLTSSHVFTPRLYFSGHQVWWLFSNIATHSISISYSLFQVFIILYLD